MLVRTPARRRAAMAAVLGVAAFATSAGAPAVAAVPGHGPRTAVTFDPDVLRGLDRLNVRVRAVDADQRGGHDRLTIVFRVTGADHGTVQHRGGIRLDAPGRAGVLLDRPVFDLRRGTVSVSTGQDGRERVTLLSVSVDRGHSSQDRGAQGAAHQDARPGSGDQGNPAVGGRPATNGQPASNGQPGSSGPQSGAGQPVGRGGGGTTAFGPEDEYSADLRLTSDGERFLDRALNTRWFRAGLRIGSAELAIR